MDRPPLITLLPPEMKELRWRPLFTLFLDIKPPYNVGKTPVAREIAMVSSSASRKRSASLRMWAM